MVEARRDSIASRSGLIKKFSSNNEVRAKAVEFLKQQVQGQMDSKTL